MKNRIMSILGSSSFKVSLAAGLLIVFTCAFVLNAWVVDDAYITFRTVHNFTNGFGLTWNVDERVQAYTHPLWMFVMSLFYFFTSEAFYTCLVVSYLFCIAAFVVLFIGLKRDSNQLWKPALLLVLLFASKSFIDYTSSGLENPLSYFLASLFLYKFLLGKKTASELSDKDVCFLFFIAALSFFNRQDTVLLYIPVLLYIIVKQTPILKWKIVPIVSIGVLPAIGWLVFSLIYYGFPFPNTAYAKALSNGLPTPWKVFIGLEYLHNSITWDIWSHIVLWAAMFTAHRNRSTASLMVLVGVLVYFAFVVATGATATHMSGRFFALPLLISTVVFIINMNHKIFAAIVAAATVVFLVLNPISAFKMGTSSYKPHKQHRNIIDTNWYVHNEGAALTNWESGKSLPDHVWYHDGVRLNKSKETLHVGGALKSPAIGYFGYAAGPKKFIVDRFALSDPLLSRLMPVPSNTVHRVRTGHFARRLPKGYIESLERNENLIEDKNIHRLYEKIRNITRGPVWRIDRFADIWELNTSGFSPVMN